MGGAAPASAPSGAGGVCPLVWIRADGNEWIASGHLRRCLSVAEALLARGCAVTFLAADGESAGMLRGMSAAEGAGIDVHILHTSWEHPREEVASLAGLARAERPDFLLVDSYFVDAAYFRALREAAPGLLLGYIDDLAGFDPPVELLLNYDVSPPEALYRSSVVRLLGSAYAPLRGQFARAGERYAVRRRVGRILITTGGTDPCGMQELVRGGLLREPVFAETALEVVLPAGWRDGAEASGRVHFHHQVSEMAALMASCDLALSAGGTTQLELCAVGVPTVSFTMAENQRVFTAQLVRAGAVEDAGDAREDPARTAEEAVRLLALLAGDVEARRRRSARMKRLVDGQGAARIAEAVIGLIGDR